MKNSTNTEKSLKNFCELMNKKAEEFGMKNSTFEDPAGINNFSTVRDILSCFIKAINNKIVNDVLCCPKYTVKIKGDNQRDFIINSITLTGTGTDSLKNYYSVLGGKGGTLFSIKQFNAAVLVNSPDKSEKLACVIMKADGPSDSPNNRFAAAKQALDMALKKGDGEVCCQSAIVCSLPKNGLDTTVLYEKNPDSIFKPASMSKILTAIIVTEFVNNLDTPITVKKDLLNLIDSRFYIGDFLDGDIVTVRDLLHAMMLPSSNSAAFILADYVGQRLLETK